MLPHANIWNTDAESEFKSSDPDTCNLGSSIKNMKELKADTADNLKVLIAYKVDLPMKVKPFENDESNQRLPILSVTGFRIVEQYHRFVVQYRTNATFGGQHFISWKSIEDWGDVVRDFDNANDQRVTRGKINEVWGRILEEHQKVSVALSSSLALEECALECRSVNELMNELLDAPGSLSIMLSHFISRTWSL